MNATLRAMFDFLRNRRMAYNLVFRRDQPADQQVLIDLAKFCRANESCVVPGDRDRTLMLEGRREVWLRIQHHLGLTDDQLFALYSGNPAQPTETS